MFHREDTKGAEGIGRRFQVRVLCVFVVNECQEHRARCCWIALATFAPYSVQV